RVAQLLSHLKLYRFAALLSASFRAPRWFWARTDPGVDGSVNAAEDTAPPRPRQADATGPDPLPDLLQEGWRAMRAEDFQLARKRFALADQHHPGDPEILYGLGMSYWRLGQLSEAIRTLRDALTKDPERAEIYKTLGTVYFDGYEYGQAVEALAKAAVLAPNDAWVHRLLGRLYVRLGGWTQTTSTLLALEELQQAFILDGDVTETFIEVSHIFHHPAERLFVMDSWIAQTGHQLSPTERRLLATHRHLLRQTGSERPDFTVGDAVLARDLERILRIANIHRVPLYLLTYAADVPQNSVIRAIAQRNRVPLIDVAAAMDQVWDTRRDQFFMLDRHPNDRGYAMMADIVAEALSRGCPSHVRLPAATPTAS
ncbi:MAG: tetratricopeptide repeat protein, partial [Candidatus Omnitrophica bacterium]|nr:tetratricopeptide repeat protein [Candidatus Omnitrophota bacterium]